MVLLTKNQRHWLGNCVIFSVVTFWCAIIFQYTRGEYTNGIRIPVFPTDLCSTSFNMYCAIQRTRGNRASVYIAHGGVVEYRTELWECYTVRCNAKHFLFRPMSYTIEKDGLCMCPHYYCLQKKFGARSCFYSCLSICPHGEEVSLQTETPIDSDPLTEVPWTNTPLDRDALGQRALCNGPLDRDPTPDRDTPPDRDPLVLTCSGGHRSGRYASYWNSCLFISNFEYLGKDYPNLSHKIG